MRITLIANPSATGTSEQRIDRVRAELADTIDTEVFVTASRDEAVARARDATQHRHDAVVVIGGDGTVNAALNGMLGENIDADPADLPALGIIPGGHANVFAHALGLPREVPQAASLIRESLTTRQSHTVGLGRANDRWFALNAGLGIDAEVISSVEDLRQRGLPVSPAVYLAGLAKSWVQAHRWSSPMHIRVASSNGAVHDLRDMVFVIVQNTAPWTMLGDLPLHASARASLLAGLDVVAMESLSAATMVRILGSVLTGGGIAGDSGDAESSRPSSARPPRPPKPPKPEAIVLHDISRIHITAQKPVPVQIDGDLWRPCTELTLVGHPHAVRVLAPAPLGLDPGGLG